jgi:hypothetical protein
MASEIKTITSESLEAAYRALTPSQSGFTQDLMASNTIIPVLDLTASAEGSSTPQLLQTALAYGSQTAFSAENSTTTVANTPGFYRVVGNLYSTSASVGDQFTGFTMTDGTTSKDVFMVRIAGGINSAVTVPYDLVFFVASGISLVADSGSGGINNSGSIRQIADVNGVLVNPSGFTPQ